MKRITSINKSKGIVEVEKRCTNFKFKIRNIDEIGNGFQQIKKHKGLNEG